MALHIIKLCVGCDSVEELRAWQTDVLARKRQGIRTKAGKGKTSGAPELYHWTRMMPKRVDDVLDGGSLYWVMKGYVRARQRILDLQQRTDKEGKSFCAIILDPPLIPTQLLTHRPFQGWRYLEPTDAPPDLTMGAGARVGKRRRGLADKRAGWDKEPPPELLQQLKELGLI